MQTRRDRTNYKLDDGKTLEGLFKIFFFLVYYGEEAV